LGPLWHRRRSFAALGRFSTDHAPFTLTVDELANAAVDLTYENS